MNNNYLNEYYQKIQSIPCYVYNYVKRYDNHLDVWKNGRTCRHRYECMGATTLIMKHANNIPKCSILDAGCSNGVATKDCMSFLKNNDYDVSIVAVDRNRRRIYSTKKNYNGIKFYCNEITDLVLKNKFDTVLCLNVIRFINYKSKAGILRKISDMLKSDGILLTGVSKKDMCEMGLTYLEPPKCALNHMFLYHWIFASRPICKYNDTQVLTKNQILAYANLMEKRYI